MNFKNKKVLIFGLGRNKEGSGISAANFFIRQGAKVIITDKKSADDLANSLKLISKKAILHLGEHKMEDIFWADIVVRNPGVPNNSPFILKAREIGKPVVTDVSIFMQLAPCPVIGVTGTRGKSTTTVLLGEIFKRVNKKTFVGGNIQRSPLTFLDKLNKNSLVVLELSSWMLESLVDIKSSPHGAIVTNLYPDHLNVHGTMAEYAAAKENIFRFQKPGDVLVLNYDNKLTVGMGKQYKNKENLFWFSLKQLPKNKRGAYLSGDWIEIHGKKVISIHKMKLKGEHNVANALAATALSYAFGVPSKEIAAALKNFQGIADRQEIIKIKNGVIWVNDTTATTPEATIAALKRFGDIKNKKIILIAGGSDKKLEFKNLAKVIKKYCKAIVLLDGTATPKLIKLLQPTTYFPTSECNLEFTPELPSEAGKQGAKRHHNLQPYHNMKEAVRAARLLAKKGDTVLLSPACASFGLFDNEFDRGKKFIKEVQDL